MKHRKRFTLTAKTSAQGIAILALLLSVAPGVSANSSAGTVRVSVATDGTQAPDGAESSTPRAVSADGRYVTFRTFSGLVSNDINGQPDIYVRDNLTKRTTLASVTADGTQASGGSGATSISANGRYVTFYSFANTLVPNDTNGVGDIFVRDLVTNTTTRASVASNGTQANSASGLDNPAQLSANGRYVVFDSLATNLVPNDTNNRQDVFVHDRITGVTTRVSVGSGGVEGNGVGSGSMAPAISASGRFVVFASDSTNLVSGDTNTATDIFVRDRLDGVTTRMSIGSNGVQSDNVSIRPTITADGRFVAFEGWGVNLVPNDTNSTPDIFVRDRQNGTTSRVSVSQNGTQSNDQSRYASISGNGRYVAFQSVATNLDSLGVNDANGDFDIFVKDQQTGKVTRENVTPQGNLSNASGVHPSLSANGHYIVFDGGDDLVTGDTNNLPDVFLRQRF
jgi:hypothetical protein